MYSIENPEPFDRIPELGMGFHFGAVRLSDASYEGVIVINGELAITSADLLDFEGFWRWRMTQGWETAPGVVTTMIMSPEPALRRQVSPSEDIALFKNAFGNFISNAERYDVRTALHASPPFPLQSQGSERFVRFSAFGNDRRVSPDGSLLPGTYVTSERDAAVVPSGFAAVGRYALPNPIAAIHRFDIEMAGSVTGLVGTVLPAFGQAGGGVEIELTQGAPPRSVTSRTTIAEY